MSYDKSRKEREVIIEDGIVGTLTIPDFLFSQTPYKDNLAPPTHKVAFILLGESESHNSKRIQKLASKLAAELGIYSLRLTMEGVGDLISNWENVKKGIERIDAAVHYILNELKGILDIELSLWTIVGYSEGATAMFAWCIKQNDLYYSKHLEDRKKAIIVPNLINCSSMFYLDAFKSDNETLFSEELEEYENLYRSFKWDDKPSSSGFDFSRLCQLSNEVSVLSIYGSEDTTIGARDFTHFANILNRGRYSHHLSLIQNADHYYNDIKNPENKEEESKTNYRKNDHNHTVSEIIIDYLKPENEIQRFFSSSIQGINSPRWQMIAGVNNFRDIGGWRISIPKFSYVSNDQYLFVKPNLAFRCASMDNICRDVGLKQLQELGISTIFDFRTKSEAKRSIPERDLERVGIVRIHCPFQLEEKKTPVDILQSFSNLLKSWYTYPSIYENMLVESTAVYKKIFEFIRDESPKGKKFVFHCSAGKDRTGIVCMLILLFMGVNKNTIAREYGLTALGLKPEFENIRRKYLAGIGIFQSHESYSKFETDLKQGRAEWKIEEDGFNNLICSRIETMLATISTINKKFGGIDNYMKEYVGLSEKDLKQIYSNLVQCSQYATALN